MSKAKSDLLKLHNLTWSERWLLLEAFTWLGLMRAALLVLPFRSIVTRMGLSQGESPRGMAPALAAPARQIGWAVETAARHTPWESACLAQGLAGSLMLRRRSLPGTLYLGVTKDSTSPEKLGAHAWLRCGDQIMTGASGRERFTIISTLRF